MRAKFPRSICICFRHVSSIGWQCGLCALKLGGEFVSLSPRKLKTFLNLAGMHQCVKVVHDNASYSSRNFKFTMLIIFNPKIH